MTAELLVHSQQCHRQYKNAFKKAARLTTLHQKISVNVKQLVGSGFWTKAQRELVDCGVSRLSQIRTRRTALGQELKG